MVEKSTKVLSARDTEWLAIVDFWNQYRICDQLGGATGELLEELERTVADCRYKSPPDLTGARAATAEAIYWLRSESET